MFLRSMYLMSLALWFGTVSFFSFGVAPSLFTKLPVEQAGQAVGAIFPVYYIVGTVVGALVLGSGWRLWQSPRDGVWRVIHSGIAAAMLTATLVAGLYYHPQASALRPQLHQPDTSPEVKARFDSLHRTAVWLNGAVLIGGLVLVLGAARRLAEESRR